MMLSEHFARSEFMTSQTAARRGWTWPAMPDDVEANLHRLCTDIGEPLREALGGAPVVVTSGWRYARLNKAIGGSHRSAHLFGRAMDIVVPGVELARVAAEAVQIPAADKIILEFDSWVHVQVAPRDARPRQQALCAYKGANALGMSKTCYAIGFEPPAGRWA